MSDMPGVGDQLVVTIEPNGDKSSQQFDPVVLESSSTMLRWQGVLCCSCCFAAEHYFVANEHEKDEPGTKFTHGERFSGCLLCPGLSCCVVSCLLGGVSEAFDEMN